MNEDDDIDWRLEGIGLKKHSVKNKAIVYHLHHKRGYDLEGSEINLKIFAGDITILTVIIKMQLLQKIDNFYLTINRKFTVFGKGTLTNNASEASYVSFAK